MNTEFDVDTFDTIEKRAAYWLVLLNSSEATPEDRYAFEAWKLEDPANEEAFQIVQRGNAFVDSHIADPVLRQIGKQALEHSHTPVWRNRWMQFTALAASVLVVIGISTVLMSDQGSAPNAPATQIAMAEAYETEIGERSTVTLSDGTIVTLNTNSRIEIDYGSERRDVTLVRGQGYFEVSKDVDRPFAVSAGDKRIVALGTAFDVRFNDDKYVEVTLVEGLVSVDEIKPETSEAVSSATITEAIQLTPGKRFVGVVGAQPQVVAMNAEEATSWRNGRLIYRSEPIKNVIGEMNRYSSQQLKLGDDPRVEQLRVSGVFNTGRASSFVTALERLHPLEARRSGENELTLDWQE